MGPLDELLGVRKIRGAELDRARGREHDQLDLVAHAGHIREQALLREQGQGVEGHRMVVTYTDRSGTEEHIQVIC